MTASVFEHVDGFDWDSGKTDKNWSKHHVHSSECEEVFFNESYYVTEDAGHSKTEQRFYLLGVTNAGRHLFVVFIIRNNRIRIISARDMSRKERNVMRTLKRMPRISSQDRERDFWSRNDSTEYVDYSKARMAFFPNLKPSTKTISIRLPESLLVRLKVAANKRDIPYQSLLKILLSEMLERESARTNRTDSVVSKPASEARSKG